MGVERVLMCVRIFYYLFLLNRLQQINILLSWKKMARSLFIFTLCSWWNNLNTTLLCIPNTIIKEIMKLSSCGIQRRNDSPVSQIALLNLMRWNYSHPILTMLEGRTFIASFLFKFEYCNCHSLVSLLHFNLVERRNSLHVHTIL